MISVRTYETEDFTILASWYQERMGIDLVPDFLPPSGYIAVDEDDDPIAVLFLYYMEGTKLCWVGDLIASPDSSSEARHEAIESLYHICHAEAKERGMKGVWNLTSKDGLKKRLKEMGYNEVETGVQIALKGL